MCLPYCTEFAYYLLDGIDRWVNNVALIYVVWSGVSSATTVYRWKDIVDQTGRLSLIVYNSGNFLAQIPGIGVAHATSQPGAGVGAGLGLYFLCTIAAVILASTPTSPAPRFWGRNALLSRFWFLAFYSGNQLRHELNAIIGGGKDWEIPHFRPLLLRYVSAPVLAIVFSFAYPEFETLRYDPLMILGFVVSHIILAVILIGFVMPRYYTVFIPLHRRDEGTEKMMSNETKNEIIARVQHDIRDGSSEAAVEAVISDKRA